MKYAVKETTHNEFYYECETLEKARELAIKVSEISKYDFEIIEINETKNKPTNT